MHRRMRQDKRRRKYHASPAREKSRSHTGDRIDARIIQPDTARRVHRHANADAAGGAVRKSAHITNCHHHKNARDARRTNEIRHGKRIRRHEQRRR